MKKYIIATILLLSTLLGHSQVQTIYVVPNITSLKAYYGTSTRLYVSELNQDYVICKSCTVNDTTVYQGVGTRKWLRLTGGIGRGSFFSQISIVNDSSLTICNLGTCDTIIINNLVVNNFSIANDSTIIVCDGNNTCDTIHIPPTPILKTYVDSAVVRGGDSLYYYTDGIAHLGGVIASGPSNITIANDSTLVICNQNGCDSFHSQNVVINNFSIVNDSTILICDGNGTCDTLHIPLTQIAKPYVDSAKIIGVTLYYYINGKAYTGGSIIQNINNGLISPGIVTWIHDSTFFVTSATYILNDKQYISPSDSVTISGIDPSLPTKFLFIVDTSGHATYLRGTPATIPLDPQVNPFTQIPLTSGITFQAGATQPDNIVQKVIYDENLGTPTEWSTGTQGTQSTDFANTTSPQHGSKSILTTSYTNNSRFYFVAPAYDVITSDEVLSAWVKLNSPLPAKNSIYLFMYDQGSGAYTETSLSSASGFNPNLIGQYQLVSIPLYSPTWYNYSGKWSELEFIFNSKDGATNSFNVDNITIQKGINNIPAPTDYSYKLDSVTIKKVVIGVDTAYISYNWSKGVPTARKDTIWTGGSNNSSGSVTRFDFTNSAGIVGTVTNPTTTPNLSLVIDTSSISGVHTESYYNTKYASINNVGTGTGISKLGTSPYGLITVNDSTYRADTSLLLTKSMASSLYVTYSNLVGNYVKYTDTSSMLSPYLHKVDTTNKWVPLGSKYVIGVIKPILARDSLTLAFDSLHLTELRYSLTDRDTTTWTDTTLVDRLYVQGLVASVGTGTGSGGGLTSSNFVYHETPSGSINGSNTIFSLANTPIVGKIDIYRNGLLQNEGSGNDYTISGTTITFVTAPEVGDVLLVNYIK